MMMKMMMMMIMMIMIMTMRHDGGLGLYSYKHHLDKKKWGYDEILTGINGVIYKVNKERFLLYEEMQMVSHMSKFIQITTYPSF